MDGLAELHRRYPWPHTAPNVEPDDHGWFQPCNQRLLERFLGPQTELIVELGSWLGLSSRFMLHAAPHATVICIDHWQGSPEHRRPEAGDVRDKLPRLYETFLRNMWPWRRRVVPLRANTVDGLREVAELGLHPDLVYVDAGHDYQDVFHDVRATRDLFPRAQIVGDDWIYFEGVRRAVKQLARTHGMSVIREENAWALTGP